MTARDVRLVYALEVLFGRALDRRECVPPEADGLKKLEGSRLLLIAK